MLDIAPPWVASVITVGVFVVTTAAGFLLMRIAFNARPLLRKRKPEESDLPEAAATNGENTGRAGA